MKNYNVGIIGATGMVGQRFAVLLENHPWFNVKVLAASPRSAGKTYKEAVGSRWLIEKPMPKAMEDIVIMDATADIEKIASQVDFVFCAVDMKKDEIKALEEAYAKRGFISVKSNCSIQSYVPALNPLRKFGITKVLACTYQAISGAGKTFETWPEMVDNLIPYIGGEEEKSEQEPLKVWGKIEGDKIVKAAAPAITTQCLRVPVSNGHFAAVFVSFENKPSKEEILNIWKEYKGAPQELELPSAPKQFLHYFEEDNMPQAKLHRNLEGGMAVSIGRLREDTQYDYKFVCLSHNTLRGAAGGAVEMAELYAAKGYFD